MNALSLTLQCIQMFTVWAMRFCFVVATFDVQSAFCFCCCCYDYLHHNSYYVWHWNTFWLRRPAMKLQKQQQLRRRRIERENRQRAECNTTRTTRERPHWTGFIIFGLIIICLGSCKRSKEKKNQFYLKKRGGLKD